MDDDYDLPLDPEAERRLRDLLDEAAYLPLEDVMREFDFFADSQTRPEDACRR